MLIFFIGALRDYQTFGKGLKNYYQGNLGIRKKLTT